MRGSQIRTEKAAKLHHLTITLVLPWPGHWDPWAHTVGHVSWAQPQPTGDTVAAAEPCPRMQKLFRRLHGQPELLKYCALPTSSCETVPSAHPFTVCFSSDEGKKLSTIKDTNINRPSIDRLPEVLLQLQPTEEILLWSQNCFSAVLVCDRVTGNTSTTEEWCSVTQQLFWCIPVCFPEKAKKQLRTTPLLACNKCNISAVSWCLSEWNPCGAWHTATRLQSERWRSSFGFLCSALRQTASI